MVSNFDKSKLQKIVEAGYGHVYITPLSHALQVSTSTIRRWLENKCSESISNQIENKLQEMSKNV